MAKDGNVRVWAWDGSRFREILIDTLGHPQVDALSVANPSNLDKAISKLIDKRIVASTTTQTGTLASGGSEIITFTPALDKMWHFKGFFFHVEAPSGASSGTHFLEIRNPGGTREAARGTSTYTSALIFKRSYWKSATSAKEPPDEANLGIALSRLSWDNSYPAKFYYKNNTDVSQTNTRYYELDTLEEYCS